LITPEEDIKKGLDFYRIRYDEDKLYKFSVYVQEIKKWNARINLTGFKDQGQIIKELIYDAFFVFTFIAHETSILDMGSGAGIISVPAAILNSRMEVFSVDRKSKKIHFQRHIKRILGLERFYPIDIPIESLDDIRVDAVIAKGFGGVEDILDKGKTLIKRGGKILILKGRNDKPLEYKGFKLKDNILYNLAYSNKAYRLFIYEDLI